MTDSNAPEAKAENPSPRHGLRKLVLEMGPLVAFFLANSKPALFSPLFGSLIPSVEALGSHGAEKHAALTATGVLMIAVTLSLILSFYWNKRLPIMPVVTVVAVGMFGVLTFIFQDETFIQRKPTVVNAIFGSALLIGLLFGKALLPIVLDSVLKLTEEGWRKLTFRWGLFFFVLAAINEVVWRNYDWNFWVNFKVWGTMPLTLIFAFSQVPLIMKHELKGSEAENAPEHF